MRTFSCQCGNTLHFANTRCVVCGLMLGFMPDEKKLSAFTRHAEGVWRAAANGQLYRKCINYSVQDVCNWMVPAEQSGDLCASCQLTRTIPNLDQPENRQLWSRMEQAKRRLLYTLYKLELPVVSRYEDPQHGLGFEFLEDETEDDYGNELTVKNFVTTGHSAGIITLNLKEAQHSSRMKIREEMNEQYRTLLGHFRHESGHYYWDRLVRNSQWLDEFRELFGDETLNYTYALQNYYQNGPAADWHKVWVSAYASMHPWEDWAETWAHYLHMVDTLETASDFDFSVSSHQVIDPLEQLPQSDETRTEAHFNQLYNDWCRLTAVLNALNRSMGLEDAYPFVLSSSAIDKLRFVHKIISTAYRAQN
ncbi:putative zinc-binding metallopeptidase [Pseudidiomarina sp.]|uniref:zinc-binding metallopeptidase family protein n=1 Tax=Pseudidiomarina sp. TaxID=2081707 RepID=UPI00299EB0FC|nr:putative zinc-binding metallopeptidase [Pseudidiomarina sp.]MDX1705562.1 putative zinc-binding metallopeptidase [Pseudidiomarina sp.]